MKKKLILFLIIFLSSFAILISAENTYADDILNIAGYKELYKCYTNGTVKNNVGTLESGIKISSLTTNNSDGQVAVPNEYNNTIADYDLSCRQLISGYDGVGGKYTGLFTNVGQDGQLRDQGAAKTLLQSMGYKSDGSANTGGKCIHYEYEAEYTGTWPGTGFSTTEKTHQICVTNITGGKFTSQSKASQNKNGNSAIVDFEIQDGGKKVQPDCALWAYGYGGCTAHEITDGKTWSAFVDEVFNDLKANRSSVLQPIPNAGSFTYKLKYKKDEDQGTSADDIKSNWVFDGTAAQAATKAINKGGFSSEGDIRFSSAQKGKLHQFYLKTFYGGSVICKEDNEDEYNNLTTADAVDAANIKSKTCRAKITKHKGVKVHGAKSTGDDEKWDWYQDYTFEELVNVMTEDELLGAASSTGPGNDDGGSQSGERDPDCHTNAGALGWILCPIIDISSQMVEKVYSGLIEPYLSIDAALFDTSDKGGAAVQAIWAIFQGFANLAFVIVFLFVIFSQLTGVGIDNYGIKKILPKLIIGAVLINMSYIICQLAVDLSNILGRAVGSLFKNIAGDVNKLVAELPVNLNPTQASDVTGKFAGVETGVLIVVGIAAVLGVAAFLAAGPAIIIPALLALLSLVVGIFFLFAMLALRQAVAVILVVISPLAFAAYMLPNTKKMFDKWFEAFKGMLIAYPIASALVYGGDFVSKILLVAGGTTQLTSLGLVLSAAVVAIAPIFFIPSVIKKGMNGIAGLGNIINKAQGNMRSSVRQPAQQRLNQSRLNDYKLRRAENRDAITSDRRLEKKGRAARRTLRRMDGRDPDAMGTRDRVRYRQALRNESAYSKSQSELSSSYLSSLGSAELNSRLIAGLEEGDMEKFGSTLDEIGGRDQGELLAQISTLSETEAWKGMNQREKAAVAAKLRGQNGNAFAQAYGKLLAKEDAGSVRSFGQLSGKIQEKVAENGTANLAGMDKDVMKWLNGDDAYHNSSSVNTQQFAQNSFSSSDLAEAMGQVSGAQQTQFAHLINTRGQQATDAGAVSSAQLAQGGNAAIAAAYSGASTEQITAAVNSGQVTDAALQSQIQHTFSDQIEDINKNNELAGATNKGLADAAGIKVGPQEVVLTGVRPGLSGSSGGGAGASGGGAPAPAPAPTPAPTRTPPAPTRTPTDQPHAPTPPNPPRNPSGGSNAA